MSLQSDLLDERNRAYLRLRGGYPIPLAGAIWWLGLSALGYAGVREHLWIFCAFAGSGLIFPLALMLAKLFGCDFIKDRTALTDLLPPAFISMLLFWPMAISAYWAYPAIVPLILGIGMSIHWPVIGWTYNRTFLFATHAVSRALVCFAIWNWFPDERRTVLPLSVALIYLLTVLAILWDTRKRGATVADP